MSDLGRSNPFRPGEVLEPVGDRDADLIALDDLVLGPTGQAEGPVLPPGRGRAEGTEVLRASGRLGSAQVAVVGLHGGAGATTAQRVLQRYSLDGAAVAWVPGAGVGALPEHGAAVLVARTSGVGLERAAQAAWQWGSGDLPGVAMVGLLLVADSPKLARELVAPLKRVSRMYPRTWRLEWVPEWHLSAEPSLDRVPRRVAGVAKKASKWATERGLEPNPKEQSL
ncbi:DUF6668 family protein [Janibacter terrae]|uniref:DUF6668 family protein n=1 Tax=Janibacter terrae TaxID=103817 RepID=UPI0031F91A77